MRCIVVGGGVVGLSVAWRARQAGLDVTIIDPEPGTGASWAAAGMLAPAAEAQDGEEALLALNVASARLYAGFVADLERNSGMAVGYGRSGSLFVAHDADDVAMLDHLHERYRSFDLSARRLRSAACRELEPRLGPGVRAGLLLPDDHHVDNRAVIAALINACRRAGVTFISKRVASVESSNGCVSGLFMQDGTYIDATNVVLATGASAAAIDGLPDEAALPIRPVKGEILRLRNHGDHLLIQRVVRALVRGTAVYVVPRSNGGVVIGATSNELGIDEQTTAGAVHQLLDTARRILPDVDELELVETMARLRPTLPDNGPAIGPTCLTGLLMATGHYRHGMLLAPITAVTIVDHLTGREPSAVVTPFNATRFSRDLAGIS